MNKFLLPTLLVSSLSFANTQLEQEWRTCARTEDCVVIPAACGKWTSLNKKYLEKAKVHFDRKRRLLECGGKFVFAEKPDSDCISSNCSPAVASPTMKIPSKALRDWAVKIILTRGPNAPVKDEEGYISRALEIVNHWPLETIVEKTVSLSHGQQRRRDTQLRYKHLCIDIYFHGDQFNGAEKTPDCTEKFD